MSVSEKPEKVWVNCYKSHLTKDGDKRLVQLYLALLSDYDCDNATLEEVAFRVSTSKSVSFLTVTLPALGKHFESCLELGSWSVFQHPQIKTDGLFPLFLNEVFRDIFDDYSLSYSPSTYTVRKIRMVRQLCFFAYKAQPDDVVQTSTVRDAIRKYVEIENSLPVPEHESGLSISWDPILHGANALIRSVFDDFSWDDLKSGHGPGSVEDLGPARKFDSALLATPYSNVRNQLFGSFDQLVEDSWRVRALTNTDFFGVGTTSEVLFVPKDSRGPRTICREPAGNMYCQQGIMKYMVRKLESHDLTKGKVNFTLQSINQSLALEASITRKMATLDLSDASDRISVSLFENLFVGTGLYFAILQSRSSFARFPQLDHGIKCVGDNVVRLRKLAPMGSAVCFTTLAVTIWALLYSALSLSGREDLAAQVYVYGDDIIVPTECSDACIKVLENYYLKVNTSKSFARGWFRESCGTDAVHGVDVTPVRLRYFPTEDYLTNKAGRNQLASFAATVHQLWRRGLFFAAIELAKWLPELPPGDGTEPYLTLPIEMHSVDTKRDYWCKKFGKGAIKVDEVGTPYVEARVYRVVASEADVRESTHAYFYRALLPVVAGPYKGISTEKLRREEDTQPFGVVSLPRQTHVVRRRMRIEL